MSEKRCALLCRKVPLWFNCTCSTVAINCFPIFIFPLLPGIKSFNLTNNKPSLL